MPEGVEVKLSAELIRPLIKDKKIVNAFVGSKGRYRIKQPDGFQSFMVNKNDCSIVNVHTRGKFMYWTFSNDYYLMSTFGMTGQWSPTEGKHPCFGFHLTDGVSISEIFFNDPRHFGTIKFVNKQELNEKLNELGWDPLQDDLTKYLPFLNKTLTQSNKPVGQIMMEQNVFAGVGNYIRAEALYLAKISPWRAGSQLTSSEVQLICQSCIDVMEGSYKHQGATIQTYKTAYGEEGRYSSCFKVYGKKKDPLGNKIIKENTPEGRAIHWCPTVQK